MHDRQKIEAVLSRRFAGATAGQIAAAANAIMGLDDEWEEVLGIEDASGCHYAASCQDACALAHTLEDGTAFRLLRLRAD